jgi:hypothetical protein
MGLGLAMGRSWRSQTSSHQLRGDAAIGFTGMDFEIAVRSASHPVPPDEQLLLAIELKVMPVSTEKHRYRHLRQLRRHGEGIGGYGERVTDRRRSRR